MISTDAILVNWSKKIRRDNGRAHSLAVLALHHILALIGEFDRFKRISYQQLEDDLGVTHNQMLAAIDTLENCGVVHRDIRFEGGRNKLYLSVDQKNLTDITPQEKSDDTSKTDIFFADTPEKPVVSKELNNSNSKSSNKKIRKENKRKRGAQPIFQQVASKESSDKKSRGMVKYEKVQSKVEIAKSYDLKYLSESQVDECWKKMKFRFFNQGGKCYCGDVVMYETDQKAISRMYLDQLMERCGNFHALMEIIKSMKFTDLVRISVGLWNLLKMGDEELLGVAQGNCWTEAEKLSVYFGPERSVA